ncbi:MAG: SGNH/GDSL hydrolase family protein [Cellulosilyticum sp.]|nr:SGNH/GDSL hydrolase family protein [Cellulosilyticum sp.]
MNFNKYLRRISLFLTLTAVYSQPLMATSLSLTDIPDEIAEISEVESEEVIDYTKYITSDKLLLPRNLYILKGTTAASERLNIFYKNALLTLSPNSNVSSSSPYGQSLMGRWLFQTLSDSTPMSSQPFELTLTARTNYGVTSQSTTVELVDTSNTNPVRLLAIGDSLTRAGVYLSQVVNSLPNVTTLGTRYYPDDNVPAREGRGGWTLEKYFSFINSEQLDSPFMFPSSVSGAHYKGNTRDWKAICYTLPNNAIYKGFQKIARGWKDEGEFLYDKNGYYKYPEIGDVMVDPSRPYDSQWVEWNGTVWQPMNVQPTSYEFNFSKYIARYKEAFAEGTPTHVSILLGANEFGFNKELDNIDYFIDRLNQMIDSIHTYDPTIKIILCTPPVAPNTYFVTSVESKEFYTEYDLRIKYITSKLLEAFDTDEALARQIYIAPMTLTLDTTNGFNYIQKNELVDGTITQVVDAIYSIHPNNEYGQLQMGTTLAAVIQKYR